MSTISYTSSQSHYQTFEHDKITLCDRDIIAVNNISSNVKTLILPINKLADTSFLKDLINLQHLDLSNNGITTVTNTENLVNLKVLSLEFNNLSSINFSIKSLVFLNLHCNVITDISFIKHFDALEKFIGTRNRIANLPTRFPSKLKHLDLSYNDLTGSIYLDIPSCKVLKLSHNKISQLSGNLQYMLEINLSDNNLSNFFEADLFMPQLETLFIDDNNITNINNIISYSNVKSLSLEHNSLEKIDVIGLLKNLVYLNLSYNFFISDISPLKSCTNLESLILEYNDLSHFKDFPKSQELSFLLELPLETLVIFDLDISIIKRQKDYIHSNDETDPIIKQLVEKICKH